MAPSPRQLTDTMGAIVAAEGDQTLADLDKASVTALYREAGALVLRGFKADDEQFYAFATRFGAKLMVDPSRKRAPHHAHRELQAVTPGSNWLNFHYEFGITPFRPDFISFWCEVPGEKGGETTLLDSVAFWKALPTELRDELTRKRVMHSLTAEPEVFTRFFGVPTVDALTQILDAVPDVRYELHGPDSMTAHFVTDATRPGKYTADVVLGTNIFRPTPGQAPGLVTSFGDGSPLRDEVLDEFDRVAAPLTLALDWGAGDVAVVDNNRVLHGRRLVEDERRRVHACQGFTDF